MLISLLSDLAEKFKFDGIKIRPQSAATIATAVIEISMHTILEIMPRVEMFVVLMEYKILTTT